MTERLGIAGTIGFTLAALAVMAVAAYVLAMGFVAWLADGAATFLPVIGLLDASPKLQSWALVLEELFGAQSTREELLAAMQWLVLVATGLGVLAGLALPELLRQCPPLAGIDLRRTHELWLRKLERRWLAVGVLAVVILFEVLRAKAFYGGVEEAAAGFGTMDIWFDLTPLMFAGFLLAQVAIVRRRSRT